MNFTIQTKGAITIFIAMIMMPIVVLCGIFIDGARCRAAEYQTNEAVNIANISILSKYDRDLKNDFGIYAIKGAENSNFENEFTKSVNKTLMIEKVASMRSIHEKTYSIDLYAYKLEDVKITTFKSLADDKELRNQILNYMKKEKKPVNIEETSKLTLKLNKIKNDSDVLNLYQKNDLKVVDGDSNVDDILMNRYILEKLGNKYNAVEYILFEENLENFNRAIQNKSISGNTTLKRQSAEYKEYLMDLLFFLDEGKKFGRLKKLIEDDIKNTKGNEDFKLSECITSVESQAIISTKLMFIPSVFAENAGIRNSKRYNIPIKSKLEYNIKE